MSEYVVRGDDCVATARSTKRLPFEPKGWQRAQRDELRQALRSLQPRSGAMLVATYASPDDARVDLENVLLYNVGAGAFSHLMTRGVACRRTRSPDAYHHVRYELGSEAAVELSGPVVGRVSAQWSGAAPQDPAGWWYRLRPGAELVHGAVARVDRFSLGVEVTGPAMRGSRLAGMLKPLLDGVVSCFSAHDGSHSEDLRPLLEVLGAEPDPWELLLDSNTAALGTQTLVRPYGSRWAWYPADDRCDAFVVRAAAGKRWSVSVEMRAHAGL